MLREKLNTILDVDIFSEGCTDELFVGRPFYLDYDTAQILVADAWKNRVKGIARGAFLLAFYNGEDSVQEAILLRALTPSKLPTDDSVVSSLVEYYKEGSDTSGKPESTTKGRLDDLTRYEFSFSGLQCRVLGAFYKLPDGKQEFGADLENFYSANNYTVYKATGKVLSKIINQRDSDIAADEANEFKIGHVRYSSSRRFHLTADEVDVYINPQDFIGKRTAAFGMTRTGKSNTVKKLIQATVDLSKRGGQKQLSKDKTTDEINPFMENGSPRYPVGQIIFDVNGEYANANLQDEGTAIYEQYKKDVIRYSVLEKPDFKVMKVNFYNEIENGFNLIRTYFENTRRDQDYVNNFAAVELAKPENYANDRSLRTRIDRVRAAYLCCLYKAGFPPPQPCTVKFPGHREINGKVREGGCDPSKTINLEDACTWFTYVWENYDTNDYITGYKKSKGREWADDDLKAMLIFLTGYKSPNKKTLVSGYKTIRTPSVRDLHTSAADDSFVFEIPKYLRKGKIVIVDLSQGDPTVQSTFSEQLCQSIFADSMDRFVRNKPNNFIQFYFEEAHNLFPHKEDKNLSQIYNRLAKEGAKLHLGMIYATQEVSSISSNILKNTQNWFIAHLNNESELRELKQYYDFTDFASSLLKFSSGNDRGFVRMKTYSNPFVVPIQVAKFELDVTENENGNN